jgi:hypothetical protein
MNRIGRSSFDYAGYIAAMKQSGMDAKAVNIALSNYLSIPDDELHYYPIKNPTKFLERLPDLFTWTPKAQQQQDQDEYEGGGINWGLMNLGRVKPDAI